MFEKAKIRFTWDIHYVCNYRCPYCWFDGKWEGLKSHNCYPVLEEIIRSWKRIYEKYGSVRIEITGGEPFLFPKFEELIKNLSEFHYIGISTNLSKDFELNEINKERIMVSPSFHPLEADLNKFLERVKKLKDKGIIGCGSYVAWPPNLKMIDKYRKIFTRSGARLEVQPFYGRYQGKSYPDGYTEEEKKLISYYAGARGGKKYEPKVIRQKGKICAAGYHYGVIKPNGDVFRCAGSEELIGNIFKDNFSLRDKPYYCDAEECKCNEWAFLLVED